MAKFDGCPVAACKNDDCTDRCKALYLDAQRTALSLLLASSCFSGEVCISLPCACARSLVDALTCNER
jgi:hypothetical protein